MEYITYEMFGAVGDGQTDDMPAIVKAHEEANRLGLPVRAKEGAVYFISNKKATAIIQTSVDWTGAKFIIDDVNCEDPKAALFLIPPTREPVPLEVTTLRQGQTTLANPYGEDLFVVVRNANHMDYIRWGLNEGGGSPRTDIFILRADGTMTSPIAFDFDEITQVTAIPIREAPLTVRGGEFTTIANQWVSEYHYHARCIHVRRSFAEVSDISHYVTGETDHGAPYSAFISVTSCAYVHVHDCLFTAHKTYYTNTKFNKPVPMGSYDISLTMAASVTMSRCSQTTDIMDAGYWGIIGTNFCRDLVFEDCVFSRFDAHQGVSNCILRRCRLGWQCLNAIGYGTFLIEDTDTYGNALVSLRIDYGSTWNGDMIIRNCTWHPRGNGRAVFSGRNDGTHDFGYTCFLPQHVTIDGLTIAEENADSGPLYIFNDYYTVPLGTLGQGEPVTEDQRCYKPVPPVSVSVKNVRTARPVVLCPTPSIMPETVFTLE